MLPLTAIEEAVRRYKGGHVERASHTYAPTCPEFAIEARRVAEAQELRSRPRLTRAHPFRSYSFEARLDGMRAKNAHRQVLQENVGLDEANRVLRQFPQGSSYVAVLGTIYGPEPISKNGAN